MRSSQVNMYYMIIVHFAVKRNRRVEYRAMNTSVLKRILYAVVSFGAMGALALGVWVFTPATGCSNEDLEYQNFLPADASADSPAPAEKEVYLTFDDGPSKNTEKILEILNEYCINATFFVIADGNNDKYLPVITRLISEGNEIGLHSCTHDYSKIYSGDNLFWEDIDMLKEKISPYGGADSRLLRFPGGSSNTISRKYGGSGIMYMLEKEAEEKGYTVVDWNVCSDDAAGRRLSASEVYDHTISDVGKKTQCIVLMHDTKATGTTVEALPAIIEWFKNAGFAFKTCSALA